MLERARRLGSGRDARSAKTQLVHCVSSDNQAYSRDERANCWRCKLLWQGYWVRLTRREVAH
jgi:hypothetical protein